MVALIADKTIQVKELSRLFNRQKSEFAEVSTSPRWDGLRGYKGSAEFDEFGLDFWLKGAWVGFNVWGPSLDDSEVYKNVLNFGTFSPNSRVGLTAAALARDRNGVAVYHDGRVFTRDGRDKPTSPEPQIEIASKLYNRIAYLNDELFFEKVMRYHFSRLNSSLQSNANRRNSKQRGGNGADPGPAVGGVRSSAVFVAHHNPITIALLKELNIRGFSKCACSTVSPDICVERDGKKLLFEVKPFAKSHDLMLACGQVLVYNEYANADQIVIVSQPTEFSRFAAGLFSVMKTLKIAFLEYEKRDKDYIFTNLDALLTTQELA